MGGGACFATALDFRIGAADCFMQYPEIDIGVNLTWQSLPLITHLVGPARAKRLVAGGERVMAPTLLDWGVLEAIAPADQLLPSALDFAERYVHKPPVAVQMIKQSVNQIVSALDQGLFERRLSPSAKPTRPGFKPSPPAWSSRTRGSRW